MKELLTWNHSLSKCKDRVQVKYSTLVSINKIIMGVQVKSTKSVHFYLFCGLNCDSDKKISMIILFVWSRENLYSTLEFFSLPFLE